MTSPVPLQGLDLVDCARANAKQGIETTADLCGYGQDLNTFRHELEKACQHMGVEFHELSDLIKGEPLLVQMEGEIVAPDTPSQL